MTLEQTSEHKVDTGPLPPLPPEPPPRRRAPAWGMIAGVALLALATIAIWWFTRPPDPMQDRRPVQVVQQFVAATEARDVSRMLEFVEPTDLKRQISPELRAYMEYVTGLQFDDSTYTLVDNDGVTAHVRLTGTVRYTIDYGTVHSGTSPVDSLFELVMLEGSWYLRGMTLPEIER